MSNIFEELFNPGARYREEEKHRLEWMRDEEGEGDPHRGPINLDSGVVQIRLDDGTASTEQEQTTAQAERPDAAVESDAAE